MRIRTALPLTVAMIALVGVRAQAVTLQDVVELSQAGIGDVVLIELIDMDDIAYPLTPSRLRALKAAGVSDQVLLALLRSGRSAGEEPTAAPRRRAARGTGRPNGCPARRRGVCEPALTRVVPVPVFVPTRPARRSAGEERASGPQTPLGFGGVGGFSSTSALTTVTTSTGTTTATTTAATTITRTSREPTYWGWGGKKRPGSWNGHSDRDR